MSEGSIPILLNKLNKSLLLYNTDLQSGKAESVCEIKKGICYGCLWRSNVFAKVIVKAFI
jgi:hypothetical protein